MDLSLSVIGVVALVLVVAVAVYLLFRDFIIGRQDTGAVLEIRRPALTDDVVSDPPRTLPLPSQVQAPPNTSLAPPAPAPAGSSATPVVTGRPAGPDAPAADTWAALWAARRGPRPFLRCRDGEDLLQRPGPATQAGAPGLDTFMAEVDLAMGPANRPLRAAQARRSAAMASPATGSASLTPPGDVVAKVLPYVQRDASERPATE